MSFFLIKTNLETQLRQVSFRQSPQTEQGN
jgi:hypothetical protein